MKIFLLESDNLVKEQIVQYIEQNYQVSFSLFEDSRQLLKASVLHHPDMIIFGLNENSKSFFVKLASLRNSFNTKLIVIISFHEKKVHYPLEIAHHILYKPFTTQDLEYCLVNYLGVKENLSTEDIQQDEIRQLDILESNNLNFDLKSNFDVSNKVTMEEVKNELYDDISILDMDVEKKRASDNKIFFNPEVFIQAKDSYSSHEEILKNYFQKIEHNNQEFKIDKNIPNTGSEQVVFGDKKEQKISSLNLSNMNNKEKIEDNILSISDFNLKFLD